MLSCLLFSGRLRLLLIRWAAASVLFALELPKAVADILMIPMQNYCHSATPTMDKIFMMMDNLTISTNHHRSPDVLVPYRGFSLALAFALVHRSAMATLSHVYVWMATLAATRKIYVGNRDASLFYTSSNLFH